MSEMKGERVSSLVAPTVLKTRTEQAMSAMTSATERIMRLETEMEASFSEYLAAQETCRAEGLSCDYEMQPSLAAGFSEFKMRRYREELRTETHQ